jgi:NAD(P)H dehydrogenase (quinone)
MYLVTGASGHLGQLVINNLLETHKIPASKIIATTRNPEKLANLAAKGVVVRAADFDNTANLAEAFKGATRLLIISTDALDRPGHRLDQHRNAIAAAEKEGVAHVIYTSMPNPENSPLLIAPDHEGTEKALTASKLPGWTILRNHWYFENLFYSLPHAIKSGTWYTAAGDGKIAHIAREDLAKAAAAALASNETAKKTYTLSGKEARTTAEIAKLVSDAVGKPIAVVQVPLEGLVQGMVGSGMPEVIARVFASFDTNTAQGRVADVTGDYKKLTSNDNTPFTSWLSKNKQAFLG